MRRTRLLFPLAFLLMVLPGVSCDSDFEDGVRLYPGLQGTYRLSNACLLEWAGSSLSGSCSSTDSKGTLTGTVLEASITVSGVLNNELSFSDYIYEDEDGQPYNYEVIRCRDLACTFKLTASGTKNSSRASLGTFKALAGEWTGAVHLIRTCEIPSSCEISASEINDEWLWSFTAEIFGEAGTVTNINEANGDEQSFGFEATDDGIEVDRHVYDLIK